MQLTKFFILLSLTFRMCWTRMIIETSKYNEVSCLVAATVDIVQFCYADRVNTVGLVGNSPEILIEKLSSMLSLSVVLLDDTTRVERNWPVGRKSRYPLQLFVVTAYSLTELESSFRAIKGSLWWNHMASFVILDTPLVSNNGCSNAFEILKIAWEMDILHAKLICLHPTRGLLIYNYNPYTGYAPNPWQLENTYRGKNDHPWTLLVQRYGKDERICKELDFDKTDNLGGYEIRSTVKDALETWQTIPNKTGIDSFYGSGGIIARMLFRALNATPKIQEHTNVDGFSHDMNPTKDIADDMINGKCDIGLNWRYQLTVENATTTYPFWYSGLVAVTRHSGYASQLSQIRSSADDGSYYGVYVVVLITLMFFKFFCGKTLMSAILDTLRIICNLPLPKLPINQSSRIYFASLFLFTITIQIVYQGKLTSTRMRRVALPNVNTKQDLINSGYKIYGYKSHARFFNESDFHGRYVKQNHLDCERHVRNEPSVACVRERTLIIGRGEETKLYISSNIIVKTSTMYVIRPDWPLEQRVNKILRAMMEADIIWHTAMSDYRKSSEIAAYKEELKNDEKYKAITLADLTFAFVILGFGLGCATVSFIVEIAIDRVHSTFADV